MSTSIQPADYPAIAAEIRSDPLGRGYARMSPQEIVASLLYRPLVPNPVVPPQVPAPLDRKVLEALLGALVAGLSDEAMVQLNDAVEMDRRDVMNFWIKVGLYRGKIPETLAASLEKALNATVPDPNWPPQVPGQNRLEAILGRGPIHSASMEQIVAALA